MDKMQYPKGLISYTSEHQLDGGVTHWLRPRIISYFVALLIMMGLFTTHIFSRIPLELTVIRDRNELFITTDSGQIENIYTLHLLNMDNSMHEFQISITGIEGAQIIGETLYTLNGGEVASLTLRVRADPAQLDKPNLVLNFDVVATDMSSLSATSESRFMRPM
jgi:polyferredoxin